MSGRRRATWSAFAACVLCGIALLSWVTGTMLRLERAEADARAQAAHELAIGAALWEMDAWLLPLLSAEAERPAADYAPFNPVQNAYTNTLNRLDPGEVVTPSPLLTFQSPLFQLHFQIDANGNVTSPQVPEGNALDIAQAQGDGGDIAGKRALLARIRATFSPKALLEFCSVGSATLPEQQLQAQTQAMPEAPPAQDGENRNAGWNTNYSQRAQATRQARQKIAVPWQQTEAGSTGADLAAAKLEALVSQRFLLPIWYDDPAGGDGLAFVRRAQVGSQWVFQGVVTHWPELARAMLARITDRALAHEARLVRVDRPDGAQQAHMLTVLPARLATVPQPSATPRWTPVRTLLAIAWLALLLTAGVAGFTLHTALAFGDRRARFASAVTHELRTPLTTFRMYSEMLAKGMVPDAERRQQYLVTLQSESDRLARLVENVLGYARIEDGRFTARVGRVTVEALLSRVWRTLEQRASDARFGLELDCTCPDVVLEVDVDAVGQILFNLVDNACKYGRPPLQVTACAEPTHVRLSLRDHGDGIPQRYRARIFAAFDRGARQPGDNEVPGVGLGLALARGLAHDLGGELTLAECPQGACFALKLPRAPA